MEKQSPNPVSSTSLGGEGRAETKEDRGEPGTETCGMGENSIVTWDGTSDPANPRNWSSTRKWLIVTTTCLMTFCVTFSSSVFSATVSATAEEFHTSSEVMVLGVSLFVLGFAIGELIQTTHHVDVPVLIVSRVRSRCIWSNIGSVRSNHAAVDRHDCVLHLSSSSRGGAKFGDYFCLSILASHFRSRTGRRAGRLIR